MIQSVTNTRTGNGTMYLGSRLLGRILAVKVEAGAVTASFDLTLTGETTEIPILIDLSATASATTWYHPRAFAAQNTDGGAATDAFVEIPVLNERIKCVIANAGATKDVAVTVIYDTASPY